MQSSHETHSTLHGSTSNQNLLQDGDNVSVQCAFLRRHPALQGSPQKNKLSLKEKIFKYLHLVRLEVFLSLYIFSRMSIKTPVQALLLHKACLYSLNFNSTICDHLTLYPDHQDQVDAVGSQYSMYGVVVSLGPSAVISSFAGPWCDKYGYKTPILLGNIGFLFTLVSILCTVCWASLPLYANIVANLPDGICGGIITILAAVFSEATVSTPKKYRFIKFFGLNLAFATLTQVADMVGSFMLGYAGMNTVLLVSLGTCACAELWVLFLFNDKTSEDTFFVKLESFFHLENLKEGLRTFVTERPGSRRSQIWCLFVAIIFLAVDYSANNVAYFYTSKMYSWNVTYYGSVQCIGSLARVLVNVPLLWLLTKQLKTRDPVIAIFGCCFITSHLVVLALAYTDWLYYVQCALSAPTLMARVGIRSHLSKLVESNEVGKIFSFLSTCESLMPVLGDTLFTQVLNLSISFFPGLVYMTAATISIVPVILLGYCTRVSRGSTEET